MTVENDDGVETELYEYDVDAISTEDFVIDHLLLESIKKHIQAKPEDVKKVFYLFYDFDMTIPEISKSLGISQSGVKNKLYRKIKKQHELLYER